MMTLHYVLYLTVTEHNYEDYNMLLTSLYIYTFSTDKEAFLEDFLGILYSIALNHVLSRSSVHQNKVVLPSQTVRDQTMTTTSTYFKQTENALGSNKSLLHRLENVLCNFLISLLYNMLKLFRILFELQYICVARHKQINKFSIMFYPDLLST